MKTLIISDTHLYDAFDERKYIFLKNLFASVDAIVLNGDFWDAYRTSFDAFISSPWNKLFPLLKAKKTIYLYGNHDQKRYSDNRTAFFSIIQKENHIIMIDGFEYQIEHGHMLQKSIDLAYPLPRKVWYYLSQIFQRLEHILNIIGSPHQCILQKQNKKIKEMLQAQKVKKGYICGHTHYAEVDIKNKFANSGFVQFGKASYLIVDTSGISLRTNRY